MDEMLPWRPGKRFWLTAGSANPERQIDTVQAQGFPTMIGLSVLMGCTRAHSGSAWRTRPGDGTVMADPLQLRRLRRDPEAWNLWRQENPTVRVDLQKADLAHMDLRLANLRDADLREANFIMADLCGADLRGADLRNANLVGARMIGIDIADTDLRGADIRTAEDLTPEQLAETRGDGATVLPDLLGPPEDWLD